MSVKFADTNENNVSIELMNLNLSDDGTQSRNLDIIDIVKQKRIEYEKKKAAIRAKISLVSSDDSDAGIKLRIGRNNPLKKFNTPDYEDGSEARLFGRTSIKKQNFDRKPIKNQI